MAKKNIKEVNEYAFIEYISSYTWLSIEEKYELKNKLLTIIPNHKVALDKIVALNSFDLDADVKKEQLKNILKIDVEPLISKIDISGAIRENSNDKDEDIKLLISNYANELIKELNIKTFTDTNDIYIYKNGYYIRGETSLATMLDFRFGSEATPYNHNIFLKYITSRTYIRRDNFIEVSNKINLKNGVLDLYTQKLTPHSPDYNFTYMFDINYNPNSKCPVFESYINSVVNNDTDKRCLEEIIGFVLTPGYQFANLVVLFGDGRNGKSTFIKLLTKILDRENCSFVAMQDLLTDRFASSNLYLKRANLCADIPSKTIESSGLIKQMTGEDRFSAQEKGKKAFDFMNTAKMIFACNELPRINEESSAIWRRLILIEFPNKFIDAKDNKNLYTEMTTDEELSGILNIALKGITRLFNNRNFTYNHDTTQERWLEHRLWFNPISSFWEDAVLFDNNTKDEFISKSDLWYAYTIYCDENHIVGVSTSNMFSRCVNAYLNQYSDGWKGSVGNQVRSWIGISFTLDYELKIREYKEGKKIEDKVVIIKRQFSKTSYE